MSASSLDLERRKLLSLGSGLFVSLPFFMNIGFSKYSDRWSFLHNLAKKKNIQKLRILYPKGCLANLQPIIKRFENISKIKIETIEAPFDNITNVILKSNILREKKAIFDVAISSTFAIPDLAESGVIRDLTPFDSNYHRLTSKSLYGLGDRYDGKVFGYQSSGDAYLLFLRKSWLKDSANKKKYFDQFGVELDIPLTWQELDRQMSFFHRPKEGISGGCLYRNKSYMHWEYWIRLHAMGILPFDRSMNPQLNSSIAIKALKEMQAASKFQHSSANQNGPYENFKVFSEGSCYANLGWGGSQKYFRHPNSPIRNDLIITQTPGGVIDGKPTPISYFNWGWSYVVHSRSDADELAYLFTLFATDPIYSAEAISKENGYFDPFRKEHFSDKSIEKVYGRQFLDSLKSALANAIPDLYIKGQGQYLAALRQGLYAAMNQNVPIEISLNAVSQKWQNLSSEFGIENQKKSWNELLSKYPDNLQKYLKG